MTFFVLVRSEKTMDEIFKILIKVITLSISKWKIKKKLAFTDEQIKRDNNKNRFQ